MKTRLRNLWGAVGLPAAGLIATVLASLYIKAGIETAAQREFDFICNEIRINIAARLVSAADILRSGVALFDASETVTREEWRIFTRRLQIDQHLPGIQGIGFAQLIPREQLAQHVEAIRREGFPDYQVRPADERETCSAIIYLEPFSDRNRRAFGYDMLSEPVRRAAMEQARDENAAALSGKVILVQETDQDVQAGALMYFPVYCRGAPTETVEQRRAAIQGWVYSPYRMTDMMRGALGNWDVKHNDIRIHLQVYDGDVLSADTLLYDSQGAGDKATASAAPVTRLTPVDFAGRRWSLRFNQIGGLTSLADYGSAWLVLLGGTIINLLWFGLMRSLINMRANAQQLRKSEEKFRLLVENSHDIIYTLATDGVCTFVSPAWTTLLGHPINLPAGQSFKSFVHPDDYAGLMGRLQKAIETGQQQKDVEYRMRHINGSWRWHASSAVPLRDEAGAIIGFECIAHDITQHKQEEQQEQAANLATRRMLIDAEQSRQALLSMMEDQKQAEDALQKAHDELEQRVRERTEELNLAKQAAETANRTKSAFLSNMSHELRTPLGAIIGFSELLAEKLFGDLNPKQAEYVADILGSGRHLLSLINDILDLAKIEAGKMELELSSFPIAPLLEDSLVIMKEKCLKHGISLATDIAVPVKDLAVQADERKLKQIMFNLLSNAAKFTPDGGAIAVSANIIAECGEKELPKGIEEAQALLPDRQSAIRNPQSAIPPPPLQSAIRNPQSAILISVSDTGIGIAKEHQARIFEEFFQVASSAKGKPPGTGLGLSLVRRMVEQHGGRLWMESEGDGKGCTFRFTIPCKACGGERA